MESGESRGLVQYQYHVLVTYAISIQGTRAVDRACCVEAGLTSPLTAVKKNHSTCIKPISRREEQRAEQVSWAFEPRRYIATLIPLQEAQQSPTCPFARKRSSTHEDHPACM